MNEDLAHDAHLRAALRHAPDHALVPPSGLSQTILAAARQAHRPVRPTAAPPPPRMHAARIRALRAWLRRLFAPRWAGAWAAGLVAALGLGLWLDLELQPTLERPAVVAVGSEPVETAARVEAVRAATPPDEAAAEPAPKAAAKTAAAAPERTPERNGALGKVRTTTSAEAPAGKVADGRRHEMSSGVAQQPAAAAAAGAAAARQDTATASPAPPPAVAAAPATERPTDPLAGARDRATAPAAVAPAAPVAQPASEPQAAARNTAGLRAALPDARKAEQGEALAAASPALTLLRRAQAEAASGSAVWTWGPPGSAVMAPFDAAAQAWLSRVVQGTRGRWVDAGKSGEALDALEVRWWRDAWPQATLRIEAAGLRWIEPGGRIRYAPLDAATLQALRNF